ncbi:hypothetical protein EOA32_17160 [Mesorhizobium sp. M1A.F.Ca.ET.072.01.1.1]|uniref:hypothetical protein n=1 Tax=Mesorhizobium sp. M1A.F.Ca.ET.072.01.1.1 TaxID=2496753 RepID=UPI000FD5C201|nr:hypothetical protein [Mesorhizobium sp. M1A.F.Ca.ET.072.01.1.1]RUW51075.1 hypothetical protein EOA32_17160 [Mesorhizobium sp. M1A.F.Ca.ET.072.01.1.1]TIV04112.1 MAG: hypothetical protein E5W04_05035 [Mesorhizobium sp.]
MKKFVSAILVVVPSVIAILLFVRSLDPALEIDNLKEQIGLQRSELRFLSKMANMGFASCHLTVPDFEKFAKENEHAFLWEGDNGLVGGFKVQRKGACIVSVTVPDWL